MKNRCFVLAVALCAVPSLVPVALAQPNIPVPTAHKTVVAIVGDVLKDGSYEIKSTDTLASVLKLADVTDRKGYSKVSIHRAGADFPVDFAQLKTGNKETDLSLQDGDIITVIDVTPRIFVSGTVTKEGSIDLPRDRNFSLKEILALAGGIKAGTKSPVIFIVTHDALGKRVFTSILNGTIVGVDGNRPATEQDKIILRAGDSIRVWDSTKQQPQKPKSQL